MIPMMSREAAKNLSHTLPEYDGAVEALTHAMNTLENFAF
jgi:hypothetical protein